jgi:hypothetical protein
MSSSVCSKLVFSTVWKRFMPFFHAMEKFFSVFPCYGKVLRHFSTLWKIIFHSVENLRGGIVSQRGEKERFNFQGGGRQLGGKRRESRWCSGSRASSAKPRKFAGKR